MNGDELAMAMVEIGNGLTWEESKIKNKTPEKKADWDDLVADFAEAEKNGWTVEIPGEMPDA